MSSMIRSLFQGRTLALAAVAHFFLASSSFAAPISYGDFSDIPPGVVMYQSVTEDSQTDPVPLYGTPSVSGNKLAFGLEPAFGSYSTDSAPSSDITDGKLTFDFMTLPDTGLTGFSISEGGVFAFSGSGTAATNVDAGITAFITINEVNHAPAVGVSPIIASVNKSWDLPTSGSGAKAWTNSLNISFVSALQNAGYAAGSLVTKAHVVIDDTLSSASEQNSSAFIDKKMFEIIIPPGDLHDDRIVPEPASAALVVLGLSLLSGARRRS